MFPLPKQYLYKVYIPVHQDRSIETNATLFSNNGTVLLRFVVRCHGQNDANGIQFNMFSPNGVTPTGLTEFDLNSPESDPVPYGPYPVNRAVQGNKTKTKKEKQTTIDFYSLLGLVGNSVFCISNTNSSIRTGILMHTGQWSNWSPPQPMPNRF